GAEDGWVARPAPSSLGIRGIAVEQPFARDRLWFERMNPGDRCQYRIAVGEGSAEARERVSDTIRRSFVDPRRHADERQCRNQSRRTLACRYQRRQAARSDPDDGGARRQLAQNLLEVGGIGREVVAAIGGR